MMLVLCQGVTQVSQTLLLSAEPCSRGWSLALSLALLWGRISVQEGSLGSAFTAPQPSRGQGAAWEGEQHCRASKHLQPCPVWMT